MKNLISKAAALRFLKKMILFCIGYIVVYSIAMIIIFCIKDDYPELLTTVTFAYFSIEIIVSAGIKIFETFKKKSKYDLPKTEENQYLNYTPENAEIKSQPDERETDYNEHT